eukprot:2778625-Heterocapsa_arctica.AAC.1
MASVDYEIISYSIKCVCKGPQSRRGRARAGPALDSEPPQEAVRTLCEALAQPPRSGAEGSASQEACVFQAQCPDRGWDEQDGECLLEGRTHIEA